MNSAAHVDNDINSWKTMGMTKAELVVRIAEDCLGWPYVYGERGASDPPATLCRCLWGLGLSGSGETTW